MAFHRFRSPHSCDTLAFSMPPSKSERRSGERIAASVPVAIKTGPGSGSVTGVTRDLSTGGVYLYTNSQIEQGSALEIVLVLPPGLTGGEKSWVCCQASVLRVEQGTTEGAFGVAASIDNMQIMPEIVG